MKAKLDLNVVRGLAKSQAIALAINAGIDPDAVRHMNDTQYSKPCFVVREEETYAIVIYDDEPETKFHIKNKPGRLQPLTTEPKP